jgi:endonuclease YncB( thermonuclease family)
MPNLTTNPNDYSSLVIDLKTIIAQGQEQALSAVNKIRLETYWAMGKRINAALSLVEESSSADFFTKLSEDLNLDKTLIYRINQFYRTWPTAVPAVDGNFLSWAHHIELLSLKDPNERNFYLEEASREDWSRTQLRKAVQKDFFHIDKEAADAGAGSLKRDPNPMHYYKALVENVIDGDTLLARVDLGFNVWISQRFRFRGINASEMNDGGAAAKTFVADKLKDIPFIVIKTYKTDMYGRFVADVFYHPTLKNKEDVAEDGFFLNQEILKTGLAILMDS